jgi:SSS family solute:Na+ symporter
MVIYFAIVFGIAIWAIVSGKREAAAETGQRDSAGYFLGGRNAGWFVIGASLFASNIGSEHLVGLAGQGASGDFPAAQFEILASIILLILGWVFVPFYIRSGVFTMPEFLERRYNSWARGYLSWVSILAYVLTKISVTIVAGGIVFTTLLGIDFWTGAILIVVSTGLYTVLGGLRAVIYTDMIQMFVLIGGSVAMTVFGLAELGGWNEMVARTEPLYLNLWRPMSDAEFPWTGIIFGAPILGIWYWCTDQFIVQRVLAARNITEARKGAIFAGFLKLLPLFIFLIPGVIAYALSQGPDAIIQFPLDQDGQPEYDAALPALVLGILPAGLKGLVIAGLLAALMSSLSSVFNSCSTLFTIDIYKKYFPQSSESRLVRVGQFATLVLVVFGLIWIPVMQAMNDGGLFQYLQSVQAYISPPIAAVFLLGIFSRRLNAYGAMAALITGFGLGILRLALEASGVTTTGNALLDLYANSNFLHFAIFLFLVCSAVLVFASLTSPPQPLHQIKDLTWSITEYRREGARFKPGLVVLSVLLLFCVAGLWLWFS